MKIQVIEANSKRPLANMKIQLQVKGKDSGFLSLTTDANGNINLEDKLNGQQIAATNSGSQQVGGQPQFVTASEGARLLVQASDTKQKSTETSGTTGGGSSHK